MNPKLQLDIATPAYVIDITAIKRNMTIVDHLKKETGCKVLLATKAFACIAAFPYMRDHLDGTTASGLYEARLGAQHFGKAVHCYAPAYSEGELDAVLEYADHIYFNSLEQYETYASPSGRGRNSYGISGEGLYPNPKKEKYGLRINPEFSQVKNSVLYNPSAPNSRFGVRLSQTPEKLPEGISMLHIHNLCENMAEDSVALIHYLMENAGYLLAQVDTLNLGGGHYITHPKYDLDALISTINQLCDTYNLDVILEPGGALVYEAGYLVSSVLDIIRNGDTNIAILDTSATCHMPDVLEMPYTPKVVEAKDSGIRIQDAGGASTESRTLNPESYTLTGKTCLTGDIIGTYQFSAPLQIGQKIIFTDMAQYSFVKNTTFNGLPLPTIALLHEDGRMEIVKEFGYEDFEQRVG